MEGHRFPAFQFILLSTFILLLAACAKLPVGSPDFTEPEPETATAVPSTVIPATGIPATEVEPTNSPTQTLAPIDPNPELNLPFFDDFNQGLSFEWRILSGSPLIDQGRLSSVSELRIEIGNSTQQNYVLEFDVSGTYENECGFGYGNYIELLPNPEVKYWMSYNDFVGRGTWSTYSEGSWDEFSEVTGWECGQIKLVVQGNSYKLYANGEIFSDFIYGNAAGSSLVITVSESVYIDNLSITSLGQ